MKKKKIVATNSVKAFEPKAKTYKPARVTAPKTMKTASLKNYVVIDYPLEGEIITSSWYAFRLGVSADRVEISIDGKDWKPCRHSAGYWWYDWAGYSAGPHNLQARIIEPK